MFSNSPKVKEYTHNQDIIRAVGIYKIICTTFYFGGDRVSWVYHIVVDDPSDGGSVAYGSFHDVGSAMDRFNEIICYTDANYPGGEFVSNYKDKR